MSVTNSTVTSSHPSDLPIPKITEAAYPTRTLQSIPVELLPGYPTIKLASGETAWVDDEGIYVKPRRYPVSTPPPAREVEKAAKWLESIKPFEESRVVWRGCHEVKWLCEVKFSQYVSSGALLVALNRCQIEVRPEYRKDSPNYEVRVPAKWMQWLESPSKPIRDTE